MYDRFAELQLVGERITFSRVLMLVPALIVGYVVLAPAGGRRRAPGGDARPGGSSPARPPGCWPSASSRSRRWWPSPTCSGSTGSARCSSPSRQDLIDFLTFDASVADRCSRSLVAARRGRGSGRGPARAVDPRVRGRHRVGDPPSWCCHGSAPADHPDRADELGVERRLALQPGDRRPDGVGAALVFAVAARRPACAVAAERPDVPASACGPRRRSSRRSGRPVHRACSRSLLMLLPPARSAP